jgi:hypothetical protein
MANVTPPASALPQGHAERLAFPKLIAKNPNYFGNFSESQFKPVFPLSNDTTYEQVTCVGYNPDQKLLEAVIQVKQPTGYLGDECTAGSYEYIRFFVDLGSGFVDAGVTAINVHDIPDAPDCAKQGEKPLSYSASVTYSPANLKDCANPVLPKVRAILSWQTIPPAGNPNYAPIWGNHLDCNIQLAPGFLTIFGVIGDLAASGIQISQLPSEVQAIANVPIPGPNPGPLNLAALAELYSTPLGTHAVPAHRFGFAAVQELLAAPVVSSQAAADKAAQFAALKIDWPEVIGALEGTNADTTYEQLYCLALEGSVGFERLTATFRIKQEVGYSGNLCTAGSLEYVAFWADWDDTCKYTYLGTVPVRVHDISRPAGEDLCYVAVLPVDLSQYRAACETPKIARVRAVLSWAVPPSTTNPSALTAWGNLIDAHVEIQPGTVPNPLNPTISILGGIPTSQIDGITGLTTSSARFAGNNLPADTLGRPCPFGGIVEVQGPEFPGYKYRIQVRDLTVGGSWQTVFTPLMLTRSDGSTYASNPDPSGYFEYQQYPNNTENLLGNWSSSGDDLWQVKIDIADLFDNPVPGAIPDTHVIQLDNTAPAASVNITTGGDCGKFAVGAVLDGIFVATDLHFGFYSLFTEPFNGPITPSGGSVETAVTGDPWTLNTAGMTPCGYTIDLEVQDRSIVNSSWGVHNTTPAFTGFCLLVSL